MCSNTHGKHILACTRSRTTRSQGEGRDGLTELPSEPLCAHQGPPFPLAKIEPFPAAEDFKRDFSSLLQHLL